MLFSAGDLIPILCFHFCFQLECSDHPHSSVSLFSPTSCCSVSSMSISVAGMYNSGRFAAHACVSVSVCACVLAYVKSCMHMCVSGAVVAYFLQQTKTG